jgi:hypothetical protein
MIFYKVKQLAAPCTITEFDDPEEAIRGAMSYDHEHEVLMSDSQDPLGNDVRSMKALIIWVIIIVAGIELGGMAFDTLRESVEANHTELRQSAEKLREY